MVNDVRLFLLRSNSPGILLTTSGIKQTETQETKAGLEHSYYLHGDYHANVDTSHNPCRWPAVGAAMCMSVTVRKV